MMTRSYVLEAGPCLGRTLDLRGPRPIELVLSRQSPAQGPQFKRHSEQGPLNRFP